MRQDSWLVNFSLSYFLFTLAMIQSVNNIESEMFSEILLHFVVCGENVELTFLSAFAEVR